jgi:hypothetical protein
MKQNLTDITVVLDRSGSMESVKADTIGGFNVFLKSQKEAAGEASLTLAQFDTEYDIVHSGKPIKDVPDLDGKTFVPRGATALLDAIGRSINTTGARLANTPEADRPAKIIFVILTDGEENSSHEFTKEKINEMIKHQTETYKWDFVFLGANQDAIRAGTSLGVSAGSSITYASNKAGSNAAFNSMSVNMCNYRSGTVSGQAFFNDTDRDSQAKAGA